MASNTRRVAYNTSIQFIGRVVTSGLGIISVTVTTRLLGVSDYGQLTTAVIYLGLYSALTDAGISNITIRELMAEKLSPHYIIGNVLVLRTLLSTLAAMLASGLVFLIYPGAANAPVRAVAIILSATLVLATIQNTITSTLAAHLKNDLVVIGDITGKMLTVVLILVCAHLKLGVIAIAWATLAGALVNFSSDLFFGLRECLPSLKKLDLEYMRKIFIVSIPLGIAGILGAFYFRADGFLLSLFRGSAEVGIYGVAYKIVELTMAFPIFFMGSVYPLMAAAHKSPERIQGLVQRSLTILGTAAAPAVIGVAVLAPEIAILLGGRSFVGAAAPMAVLMLGNYFVFTSFPYNSALLVYDRQALLARAAAIALAFNILLNLVAIPRFGVMGAAWSVVLTEVLVQMLLRHYYHQTTGVTSWTPKRFQTLINACVMGLAVYGLKLSLANWLPNNLIKLLICAGIGLLVYLILSLATKTIDLNEIRGLSSRVDAT